MYLVAENLNSSSTVVHAALVAGDRGWLESRARRLAGAGIDAIDGCAASLGAAEADVLSWMVEVLEACCTLPLWIDTGDAALLARTGRRRRRPVCLNSVELEGLEASPVLPLVREEGAEVVVQLRRGSRLPADASERLAWTEQALSTLERVGVPARATWIDPVLMPWGDDVEEGRPLLECLEPIAREFPGVRTVVGLSNVSYGHPKRSALHCAWLERLREAGLHGAILDALDPELLALARR